MSAYHCILTFGSKYHKSILSHGEFPKLWELIYALTLNGDCAPLAIYACATLQTLCNQCGEKTPETEDMEALKPKCIRSALSDDIWHLALALGSVSGASNSQQAMWESSHQQVSVKSAPGSRQSRCLQLFPLSPSFSGRLLIDSQSISTFFGRRCESLHCPAAPTLLKCADELTRSRQIRTCYLKSAGLGTLINLRGPSVGFMLLHNVLKCS